MIDFRYNDGGRSQYFKGEADDCVARAVAIASGRDYLEVYNRLAEGNASQRGGKKSARNGINTKRKWFKDYMVELGFIWYPLMKIGSGCTTHLTRENFPAGRYVANVSKHLTAVIDGVLHDTFDCSRDGTRCVYGVWRYEDGEPWTFYDGLKAKDLENEKM